MSGEQTQANQECGGPGQARPWGSQKSPEPLAARALSLEHTSYLSLQDTTVGWMQLRRGFPQPSPLLGVGAQDVFDRALRLVSHARY